jgi:hypothetical protein
MVKLEIGNSLLVIRYLEIGIGNLEIQTKTPPQANVAGF